MDAALEGRTIGQIANQAILELESATDDANRTSYRDFAYERLCEFIEETGRKDITLAVVKREASRLRALYNRQHGVNLVWIEDLAREFSEDNDHAAEWITIKLNEHLDENHPDDVAASQWRKWAEEYAEEFFRQY